MELQVQFTGRTVAEYLQVLWVQNPITEIKRRGERKRRGREGSGIKKQEMKEHHKAAIQELKGRHVHAQSTVLNVEHREAQEKNALFMIPKEKLQMCS